MLSGNTKALLLVLLAAMAAMLLVGCEDTTSDSSSGGTTGTYSGYVTKSQVKNAIKALETSGFGVTVSGIGAELTAKYGQCNASHDLYKAVKERCVKMGLGESCTGK